MSAPQSPEAESCDVLVVGAGFAGIYTVIRARAAGLDVRGIEAGSDVGGTWYWNRYPGARCDVESIDYSYSFDEELQREWVWSERFAAQPEIRAYISHVADRYDVRPHFRFDERVTAARFDEASARWQVGTDAGTRMSARHLVLATGSLSAPHLPDIPGVDRFAGEVLMTAAWPEGPVDVSGKRVGVIGTGSSGIQSVPILAESAAHLTVFQRSANYTVPASNRPFDESDQVAIQRDYPQRRATSWASTAGSPHVSHPQEVWDLDEDAVREALEQRWQEGGVLFAKTFPNQTIDPAVNDIAREFAEAKIRSIVRDPQVAEDLIPTDHPIGTKRICTDDGYYATFNRDNVSLVNLRRTPIEEITADGIRTTDGLVELDVLVFATGFDAMTGAVTRIDIVGPRGESIADAWADGPVTYLGMTVPGFPNLFALNGPGSPSVLANMVLTAEQQVNWMVDLITHCDAHGHTLLEPRRDAAEAWFDHVNQAAAATLFPKANSWYMGANIDGKTRVFMPYIGGFKRYLDLCDEARDAGYAGFVLGS